MSLEIGIQGIGALSPWGMTLTEHAAAYAERRPALMAREAFQRFPLTQVNTSHLAPMAEMNLKPFIPAGRWRRYDDFSRLGIAATRLALDSAPRGFTETQREDMGIVCSNQSVSRTTAEYLKVLFEEGPEMVSPRLFPLVSVNTVGCNIAMEHGIRGPSVTVGSTFAAGFVSLYTGAQMLRAERASHCLVAAIDSMSQIVMEAHSRFGSLKTDPSAPHGIYVSEATASVVLGMGKGHYGTILRLSYASSPPPCYHWPDDVAAQVHVLRTAKGDSRVDRYFPADNGDSRVAALDQAARRAIFGDEAPLAVPLKRYLGECSTMPILQLLSACLEPAGARSLISVIGPGGVHGAMLVESSGRLGAAS